MQGRKNHIPASLSSRARVNAALNHKQPDRAPVDFLAVPEIYRALLEYLQPDVVPYASLAKWMEPEREAILVALQSDCRLLSYDMFIRYPEKLLRPNATEDWWSSASRSTPNRMWRQICPDGLVLDVFGVGSRRDRNPFGMYENVAEHPLANVRSVKDLESYCWPEPDWWDFSEVPEIVDRLTHASGDVHVRYRVGSVFEIAWQLCGLEKFLIDLLDNPELPGAIMDRLSDLHVENTTRFLERAAGRVDMIYVYDDVATAQSLLVSQPTWETWIRPRHERIIRVARKYGVKFMYHSDGAIRPLIPAFIDMGIDLLNPIQTDALGMSTDKLKNEFGDKISFHGGLSVVETLPRKNPDEIRKEVRRLVRSLGKNGGYILSSSHHIQGDTPVENVLAMYETALR